MDKLHKNTSKQTDCRSCMYFDYDETYDMEVCNLHLDEDEMVRFMQHTYSACPYYRFYDEYKMVEKQN